MVEICCRIPPVTVGRPAALIGARHIGVARRGALGISRKASLGSASVGAGQRRAGLRANAMHPHSTATDSEMIETSPRGSAQFPTSSPISGRPTVRDST